mgnify:FL=1
MAKRKLAKSQRRKDYMGGKSVLKYILIPCTIAIVASCIFLIWYINNQNSTYSNIEYIRGFMTSSGKLNDYSNKLGMHDPETDIKWYKTDDEIRIEFGRIYLTWEPEKFYQQENLDALETIGFTIKVKEDKDGNKILHLYYQGEEVERWVK